MQEGGQWGKEVKGRHEQNKLEQSEASMMRKGEVKQHSSF